MNKKGTENFQCKTVLDQAAVKIINFIEHWPPGAIVLIFYMPQLEVCTLQFCHVHVSTVTFCRRHSCTIVWAAISTPFLHKTPFLLEKKHFQTMSSQIRISGRQFFQKEWTSYFKKKNTDSICCQWQSFLS